MDVEECYSRANQAKHLIKDRRDCSYAFYDEMDYQKELEDRELEENFEKALEMRQFEVWYQPKYSATNSKIVGAEALVRWRRKDGSLVSPGKFIPLFEKNGMICILDEYVFQEVCKQQKSWLSEGKKILPVSVNISRASLYYTDIVERYRKIMENVGISSKYIEVEITESAAVDNSSVKGIIEEFSQAGFYLLLDDFGSGYSSLSTLNTIHFDNLKLDKSLVDYIGDKNGELLICHIVALAKSMGMKITAEGVETEKQLIFLKGVECNDIQGFYFSRPLPKTEYQALM
jgi:EAL domain-containing protein (putative c-di-GMP-specific phosphodiesterase class I)